MGSVKLKQIPATTHTHTHTHSQSQTQTGLMFMSLRIRLSQSHPIRASSSPQEFTWKQEWTREGEPKPLIQKIEPKPKKQFYPDCATLSSLLIYHAENGLFHQAQSLWGEIINSSFIPNIELISTLMESYAELGQFDEILRILDEITSRNFDFSKEVYSLAVACFGKTGQLQLMEETVKKMVAKGYKIDSLTGNTFVKYYSRFGSIQEMEIAYQRLKKSRILVERDTVRDMASAYINERKYYKLGVFLKDLGLGRRNLGNLLWNLLLLSYAVNFKMKSLQREFLNMLDQGFKPDLNTFNIRVLAFSRMLMFWDLHLSLDHMRNVGVGPDLVTYGCFVDCYLERRLGRNLNFALDKMDAGQVPVIRTDPLVFEAFGKGDFHASSEILLESTGRKGWTYAKVVGVYLKKRYRSNQIFWNY